MSINENNYNNPSFLYHGSPHKIDILKPSQATGVGDEKYRLNAVYASHIRNMAIAFALPILPDKDGRKSISISYSKDWIPKIDIKAGSFDVNGIGYLYALPIASFEKIDNRQWVSFNEIIPIKNEIVYARDYIDWID